MFRFLIALPLAVLLAGAALAQTPTPQPEFEPAAAPTPEPVPEPEATLEPTAVPLTEEERAALDQALEECMTAAEPDTRLALCDDLIKAGSLDGTDLAAAHLARGEAYQLLGTWPLAIADYETSLELHPNRPRAHLRRAQVLDMMGRSERALEDIEYALRLNPGYVGAIRSRAIIYCRLERYEEALEDRLALIEDGHWPAEKAQEWLIANGYLEGTADGNFGDASVAALRTWTEQGCPRP